MSETTINEVRGWRYAAIVCVSLLIRSWTRTLRIEISPEDEARLREKEPGRVFLFWHNRLFIASEIIHRFRGGNPVSGLISASKDGAWLAALYKQLGIGVIRGSSSYRGTQALQECLQVIRAGADIAITPDGPRGPRYTVKPGPLWIATQTRSALSLVSAHFCSAYRFKSWDGFYLPYPFSKIKLQCVVYPNAESLQSQFPNAKDTAAALKAALDALHDHSG